MNIYLFCFSVAVVMSLCWEFVFEYIDCPEFLFDVMFCLVGSLHRFFKHIVS